MRSAECRPPKCDLALNTYLFLGSPYRRQNIGIIIGSPVRWDVLTCINVLWQIIIICTYMAVLGAHHLDWLTALQLFPSWLSFKTVLNLTEAS